MRDQDLARWRDACADLIAAAAQLREHGATARDLEAAAADVDNVGNAIRAEAADMLQREGRRSVL